jgi:hypothetical protein
VACHEIGFEGAVLNRRESFDILELQDMLVVVPACALAALDGDVTPELYVFDEY